MSRLQHPTMLFIGTLMTLIYSEEVVGKGWFQSCDHRCQGHGALGRGLLADLRRQDLHGCCEELVAMTWFQRDEHRCAAGPSLEIQRGGMKVEQLIVVFWMKTVESCKACRHGIFA